MKIEFLPEAKSELDDFNIVEKSQLERNIELEKVELSLFELVKYI